jgi:hypothetical protein
MERLFLMQTQFEYLAPLFGKELVEGEKARMRSRNRASCSFTSSGSCTICRSVQRNTRHPW